MSNANSIYIYVGIAQKLIHKTQKFAKINEVACYISTNIYCIISKGIKKYTL